MFGRHFEVKIVKNQKEEPTMREAPKSHREKVDDIARAEVLMQNVTKHVLVTLAAKHAFQIAVNLSAKQPVHIHIHK